MDTFSFRELDEGDGVADSGIVESNDDVDTSSPAVSDSTSSEFVEARAKRGVVRFLRINPNRRRKRQPASRRRPEWGSQPEDPESASTSASASLGAILQTDRAENCDSGRDSGGGGDDDERESKAESPPLPQSSSDQAQGSSSTVSSFSSTDDLREKNVHDPPSEQELADLVDPPAVRVSPTEAQNEPGETRRRHTAGIKKQALSLDPLGAIALNINLPDSSTTPESLKSPTTSASLKAPLSAKPQLSTKAPPLESPKTLESPLSPTASTSPKAPLLADPPTPSSPRTAIPQLKSPKTLESPQSPTTPTLTKSLPVDPSTPSSPTDPLPAVKFHLPTLSKTQIELHVPVSVSFPPSSDDASLLGACGSSPHVCPPEQSPDLCQSPGPSVPLVSTLSSEAPGIHVTLEGSPQRVSQKPHAPDTLTSAHTPKPRETQGASGLLLPIDRARAQSESDVSVSFTSSGSTSRSSWKTISSEDMVSWEGVVGEVELHVECEPEQEGAGESQPSSGAPAPRHGSLTTPPIRGYVKLNGQSHSPPVSSDH
ncbi:hypothetical protein BaRGS_00032260 [Batillaria attramentaria]|uniref:Uncharacterized protein n=1 Tax=Batillaria attramentaria TaxID=370345 RepID=A0ABD0JNH4_9CAEN